MREIIIAKLIKDLPDIKAGALFTSLSKEHWRKVNNDEFYDYRRLYYFYDDQYSTSLIDDVDNQACFDYENLTEWCLFFDYSCGKFLPLDRVNTLTLAGQLEITTSK